MNEKIIAKAEEFVASAKICVLALIDDDGYPTAATINPSKTEGIKYIYFGNNIDSNWDKRAEKCNRASVCFNSISPECNVTLVGIIEILTDDLALKKEIWVDWMGEYYSGPEDPKFCVMRFKTQRYSLFVDSNQVRGML
ncbi:MAG: pyridoxamine 5'-phosphate oxidase family protein [Oscillospiraceae bacterium]|nr:pyridoxamine 5'-phosphate oxidase family protein [Oscillospiraceae bacterium]